MSDATPEDRQTYHFRRALPNALSAADTGNRKLTGPGHTRSRLAAENQSMNMQPPPTAFRKKTALSKLPCRAFCRDSGKIGADWQPINPLVPAISQKQEPVENSILNGGNVAYCLEDV